MKDDEQPPKRKKLEKMRLVDSDGESMIFEREVGVQPANIRRGNERKRGGPLLFAMFEKSAIPKMHRGLSPTQMYLVMVILTESSPETNECRLTVTEIAKIAGIHRVLCSRSLTVLQERGFVQRLGLGRYTVNPHIGWRGNAESWHTAMYTTPQPQWLALKYNPEDDATP